MLVSESITRMRRTLRDTNSKVFTDAVIVRALNEMQMWFCSQTGILQTYTVLPVPAITNSTRTHRWEEDFISRPSNLLYNFMLPHTHTQPWEPVASLVDLDLDPQLDGGFTSSQQWESFYVTIQNRLAHYFPDDYIEAVFVAYDDKPIEFVFREEVDIRNEAFKSKEGLYPYIYVEDVESSLFYLYPKVTGVYGIDDMDSDYGVIGFDEDDNINPSSADHGVVVFSTIDDVDSDYGVVVYYQRTASSLYLVYNKEPLAVTSTGQTLDIPKWCVKYVEFAVMERLLKAETDLYDNKLARHFRDRYTMSLSIVRALISKTKAMRVYKLSANPSRLRRARRLADLPSHYPSLWR